MKRFIMLAMVMVTMLVSLGGCFPGFPERDRGERHDRGDRHDRGEQHDNDRDGGHERGERHEYDRSGGHDERR